MCQVPPHGLAIQNPEQKEVIRPDEEDLVVPVVLLIIEREP